MLATAEGLNEEAEEAKTEASAPPVRGAEAGKESKLEEVAQTPKEETAETTTKASPPVAEVAQLALKMMEAKERMDKLPTKFVKPEEEEVMEEQTPKHAQLDRKRPMEGVPHFVKPEEEEPEEGASQAENKKDLVDDLCTLERRPSSISLTVARPSTLRQGPDADATLSRRDVGPVGAAEFSRAVSPETARYTPTPGVVAAVATVARVKAMQRLQDPYGINQSSRTMTYTPRQMAPSRRSTPAWTELAVKAQESCQRALQVAAVPPSPGMVSMSPITLHSDSPGSVQRSPGYPVLCRSMGPTYSPPPTARTQYLGHTISSPVLHGSRSPPVPAAPGFRSGSPEPVVRPLMHSYPRQGSPMVTTYRRQGSPITWRQGNPSLGAYGRQGSPTSLATYGRQGNPTSLATYGRQGSTLWTSSMLKTSTTCLASTPCLARVSPRRASPQRRPSPAPGVNDLWLPPTSAAWTQAPARLA